VNSVQGATSQPISWLPLGGTTLALTKQHPMNDKRHVALRVTPANGSAGGIINTGFWGVPVEEGCAYELSIYLKDPRSDTDTPLAVEVSLESSHGSRVHATVRFDRVEASWRNYRATLHADATDTTARLAIRLEWGQVLVGMVSLFPAENGAEGSVSPFRRDLLDLMRGLRPKFLRFPGGCYVEGVQMRNGYFWKPSVGPVHERPGHWNGMWQYWSTDGALCPAPRGPRGRKAPSCAALSRRLSVLCNLLSWSSGTVPQTHIPHKMWWCSGLWHHPLFRRSEDPFRSPHGVLPLQRKSLRSHVAAGLGLYEYMLLTEELGAAPVWVINNGLSHEESVPTARIQPLLQDALDSIEFITGPADSRWGALRASMGHPEPWRLPYIGIGNEVRASRPPPAVPGACRKRELV
jgi:hypothetical protein